MTSSIKYLNELRSPKNLALQCALDAVIHLLTKVNVMNALPKAELENLPYTDFIQNYSTPVKVDLRINAGRLFDYYSVSTELLLDLQDEFIRFIRNGGYAQTAQHVNTKIAFFLKTNEIYFDDRTGLLIDRDCDTIFPRIQVMTWQNHLLDLNFLQDTDELQLPYILRDSLISLGYQYESHDQFGAVYHHPDADMSSIIIWEQPIKVGQMQFTLTLLPYQLSNKPRQVTFSKASVCEMENPVVDLKADSSWEVVVPANTAIQLVDTCLKPIA